MRAWRKVYKSLSTSAKASEVSDAALALYMLLLLHQDDAGRIPWNKAFARAVTANRDWTWAQTQEFCAELVKARLVTRADPFLTITKGTELNGKPHDAKQELLYPDSYDQGTPVVTTTHDQWSQPQESGGVEKSRGEEKRERETPFGGKEKDAADAAPAVVSKKRPKVKPFVSEEFIQRMEERFSPTLGGTVRERIAEALGHKAARNVIDEDETGALSWERYVTGWLRRDAERTPPGSARPPYRNGQGPPGPTYAGLETIRAPEALRD